MLPRISGESLPDDWTGFPFRGFAADGDRKLCGKHAARVMKTALKEHRDGCGLSADLPGFKKDPTDLQLQNGALTSRLSRAWVRRARIQKAASSIRSAAAGR